MPNSFARTNVLPNVCGRIDYISNPDRQENLLAFYDATEALLGGQFWETLAAESRQSFELYGRNGSHCREGREVVTLLSNSLLDRLAPEEIAQIIADAFQKNLGLDTAVAIHFNEENRSLHAHIILPERQLLEEPVIKTADRNLFFDAEGKRRYKKSDVLDGSGNLLPGCRIVKKGEIYEQRYFSSVDLSIRKKEWLSCVKKEVLRLRNEELKGDIEITEYDPTTGKLAQQYVGKKADEQMKGQIQQYNQLVRTFNRMVEDGEISREEALAVQFEVNHLEEKNEVLAARIEEFRRRWYSRPGWLRDAEQPYKIYRYDKDGRKRSTIELLCILAATIIKNESLKADTLAPDEAAPSRTIYAKRDWKLQNMVDTIRISREEGVQTPDEIDARIQQTGADLSRAKAAAQRLSETVQRMRPVMQAIRDVEMLQERCEKIYAMPECLDKTIGLAQEAANLKRYEQAKADMYRCGVAAPEGRQAFLERYSAVSQQQSAADERVTELKAQYSRLSKLKHNVAMAQNKQYCYDIDWGPEQEELQPEEKRQLRQDPRQRYEDAPTDLDDR